MYADFDYYSNTFCACEPIICEEKRVHFLKRASEFLDSLFLNGKPKEPYDECVKNACCAVAEVLFEEEKRRGISSENNDGYSVSFVNFGEGAFHRAATLAAKTYLGHSGLLYKGVRP